MGWFIAPLLLSANILCFITYTPICSGNSDISLLIPSTSSNYALSDSQQSSCSKDSPSVCQSKSFSDYLSGHSLRFNSSNYSLQCSSLLPGQYRLRFPEINWDTQQPINCTQDNIAFAEIIPAPGIICNGRVFDGYTAAAHRAIHCQWTSGYRYERSLVLSLLGGLIGLDRLYLGYAAIGIFKMTTAAAFGLLWLLDLLLIALQVVLPADGSAYLLPFYGPRLIHLSNNASLLPYLSNGSIFYDTWLL